MNSILMHRHCTIKSAAGIEIETSRYCLVKCRLTGKVPVCGVPGTQVFEVIIPLKCYAQSKHIMTDEKCQGFRQSGGGA